VTGQTEVESTVSPEYTLNEQLAPAVRGIASIVEAIRATRVNKEIARLRQHAAANADAFKNLLATGTASHLETTLPSHRVRGEEAQSPSSAPRISTQRPSR
jgi:Xaa-Pro aminopeptidase